MKVRIQSSYSGVLGLPTTALVLSLSAMGCASARSSPVTVVPIEVASAPVAVAGTRSATPLASTTPQQEEEAQSTAQHAWCKYLEALFLRSTDGAKRWPRRAQCDSVRTPAAPAMLQRTAECSMTALEKFEGDPFTTEYAAEVTRCGRESLDATTISENDLAPFVKAICARAVACGSATELDCREDLADTLGPNLRRAIGAINPRGRAELRACFDSVACDATSTQISGCLTPIMDRLLWLPE